MAQGRCAGCGKTGQSCKGMKNHILECPAYVKLYKSDPSKALMPEQEFERWQREENSEEARAAARDVRLAAKFAELDSKRDAQSERWAQPPDLLDD